MKLKVNIFLISRAIKRFQQRAFVFLKHIVVIKQHYFSLLLTLVILIF